MKTNRLDGSRRSVPTSWNQSCFHNLEGEIQLALAKPENAAQSFGAAAQEYPQVSSYAGLARAHQALEQWDMAAREWEQVLYRKAEILQNGFPPDLAYAHFQLARTYRQMNKPDLALSQYKEILRMWQRADETPLLRDARRESQLILKPPPPNDTAESRTPTPNHKN